MNALLLVLIGVLTILALPALVVLFVGLFVTGIGAVAYILIKIGIIAVVVLGIAVLIWLLESLLS